MPLMGLTPTASVELLAHLCRDGEARGHVQPPLGHLTQVSSLATQLQSQGVRGGRGRGAAQLQGRGGGWVSRRAGSAANRKVRGTSSWVSQVVKVYLVGQTQKGVGWGRRRRQWLGFTDVRWGPEGVERAAHQCLHLLRPIALPVQKRVDPPQAAGKVHLDRSLALVCVESAR